MMFKRSQDMKLLRARIAQLEGMIAAHHTLITSLAAHLDENSRKRIELGCKLFLSQSPDKSGHTTEEDRPFENGHAMMLMSVAQGLEKQRKKKRATNKKR